MCKSILTGDAAELTSSWKSFRTKVNELSPNITFAIIWYIKKLLQLNGSTLQQFVNKVLQDVISVINFINQKQ